MMYYIVFKVGVVCAFNEMTEWEGWGGSKNDGLQNFLLCVLNIAS